MTNREAILAAADYLERNLREQIDMLEVAKRSGLSLYHFIRTFHGVTGFTPYSYLSKRRLSEAARELVSTNKKIIEIAFDYGFGTHESFTRAFKREFGSSPQQLRNAKNLNLLSLVGALSLDSCIYHSKMRQQTPEVVTLPQMCFMGHAFFLAEGDDPSIIGRMWNTLQRETDTLSAKTDPVKFYQLQYWSEYSDYGGLFFMTAVEVPQIESSSVLVSKIIPPCSYLKFRHRGLAADVGHTYKFIYNTFLPESSFAPAYPFNFEYYGPLSTSPDDENSESEIYIPVK